MALLSVVVPAFRFQPICRSLPRTVPAGDLISSAQDMAQYLIAQLNDGRYLETAVLSSSGIAQLHDPAGSDGSRRSTRNCIRNGVGHQLRGRAIGLALWR